MDYSKRFVVEPGAKVSLRSSRLFTRRMENSSGVRARRANRSRPGPSRRMFVQLESPPSLTTRFPCASAAVPFPFGVHHAANTTEGRSVLLAIQSTDSVS
jgi:hypothetical protein